MIRMPIIEDPVAAPLRGSEAAAAPVEETVVHVSTHPARGRQPEAFSSAAANIAPTSKPDCSVISTKHVGLVTLTSVR